MEFVALSLAWCSSLNYSLSGSLVKGSLVVVSIICLLIVEQVIYFELVRACSLVWLVFFELFAFGFSH